MGALLLATWAVTIDRMANTNGTMPSERLNLGGATAIAGVYVVISLATLAAVAVLAAVAPHLATSEAWGHAVVVVAFAVLLPLRLRAARRGSVRALRASLIIALVILVANIAEAALPGLFPVWMRIDMVVIAGIMLLLTLVLARVRR